jgi:hypothetical protein
MVLAQAEPHIAANYDKKLVPKGELQDLGNELRAKLEMTDAAMREVSGKASPVEVSAAFASFFLHTRNCNIMGYCILLYILYTLFHVSFLFYVYFSHDREIYSLSEL